MSTFELAATSPDDADSTGSGQYSDLRYVGVTSDYAAQVAAGKGLAETSIWFGIATWADWASPNTATVQVLIDTNRDGTDDYSLTSSSAGGSSPNDVFSVLLCKLSTGSCNGYYLNGVDAGVRDTALFGTNVMVLPVLPGWLGLTAGASRFNYKVVTAVDSTATLTYDPAHPGLSFGGTSFLGATVTQPLYTDLSGQVIPVQYDRADYLANASSGLLLLHHFNAAGNRAQVVTVVSPCNPTCSATVPATAMIGIPVQLQASISAQGCGGSPSWDWDFGDGTPHASTASPTHTYGASGTFTWSLTVTQDGRAVRQERPDHRLALDRHRAVRRPLLGLGRLPVADRSRGRQPQRRRGPPDPDLHPLCLGDAGATYRNPGPRRDPALEGHPREPVRLRHRRGAQGQPQAGGRRTAARHLADLQQAGRPAPTASPTPP